MQYYDFNKLMSYSSAYLYFLNGGRGIGKTFNARILAFERWLKSAGKSEYEGNLVAVTRYKANKKKIEQDYFTKIQRKNYFTEYAFKWDEHILYAKNVDMPDGYLPAGYCVALTEFAAAKEQTFYGLRDGTVLFDEVTLMPEDRHHNYLPDEYKVYFLNMLSSLLREDEDNIGNTKIILMGNSVDITCPYFQAFDIEARMLLNYGTYWRMNKRVLYHNIEPRVDLDKARKTIVGALSPDDTFNMMFKNEYNVSDDYVAKKPKGAYYIFGVAFGGAKYGVWKDDSGNIYVNRKCPTGQGVVYYLTLSDGRIDYQAAKKVSLMAQRILSSYYTGAIFYNDVKVKAEFSRLLRFLGVQ